MKSRYPEGGFTIIEAVIFLTVSAALFGSVVGAMVQQTRRTEFVQSVDNLQVRLQDALNDVSTGFYPSDGKVRCDFGPVFPPGPREQGTNVDCIFIGNAIQFEPGALIGTYNIYSIVGNRQKGSPREDVTNLKDAKPVILGANSNPGIVDSGNLLSGVDIMSVYLLGSPAKKIPGFALTSTFPSTVDLTTKSVSGNASRVNLQAILYSPGPPPASMSPNDFGNRIRSAPGTNLVAAPKGILICIQEQGSNRRASIKIGGNAEKLSLERTIDSWPVECP